jgi:hypothetical protein
MTYVINIKINSKLTNSNKAFSCFHRLFLNSRSVRNTVSTLGLAGNLGTASRRPAITLALSSLKKVWSACSRFAGKGENDKFMLGSAEQLTKRSRCVAGLAPA